MAVSLRVTGAWAELTNDGAVAIPATPQAGDRMYLFARWKDFSVTAQVTSPVTWTEIAEFTDGAVTAGNGTGSVKVACWYRDWQSGDTNPTIDFSAAVENASVVIMVMQKAADDGWTTPVAKTAAMTNWTTTSQIVAASATAVVPSGGVVMGLIGIRDDSATMTRPTSGIDDSTGAITWDGDYVESPATHHTTTTGFDGATDLGYRLVTTGATATLRMTGTISAAETGAALWIVQGVEFNLTVQDSAHAHSIENVALTQVHALTVANASHSQTAGNLVLTQDHVLDVQSADHAHTADSVTLEVIYDLVIDGSVHSHTAESIELTQVHQLSIANGLHSHAAESLTLTQVHELVIASATHSHTVESPLVRPTEIVYLDPGGDAVQAVGYFNNDINTTGLISFDSTQKVVGVGSYKFDSDDGTFEVTASVAGVLGLARRVSTYFRYDSVPDAIITATEFDAAPAVYSGGGFNDLANFTADDGFYATATPAQNAGQGTAFSSFGLLIGVGKVIDSVKIIYERKYDVNTSIGISRVKYRIDGVEGPDHDNTDEPLTDTVVTVDVTADRAWTWQDLQDGVFEVIVEARRGDTATAHTQSWDYVKVEVEYHQATVILKALNTTSTTTGFQIAIIPKGAGCVLRFVDGAGESYDGITDLLINTWNRISFGFIQHGTDDLDIKLYVNGIEELSIVGAATGGTAAVVHLHYGWIFSPGASHLCWFDQLYIDDGDDLSDCGNKLSTHKGPASTNENNWNTTIGTGAVDERPLSITNGKQHTSVTGVRQTYTLQAASVGDIDLTGETLVGYMGWAWARTGAGDLGDALAFIVNNVEQSATSLGTTAMLLKRPVTSSAYPSDAAGIGMRSNDESADTFMYECGAIVAYEGPVEDQILPFQLLAQDSLTDLTDDLRAAPPSSYELCYRSSDSTAALATVTVSSLDQEDGSIQQQAVIPCNGGIGRVRITPGIEVQISIAVTGGDISLGLWHRLNVD